MKDPQSVGSKYLLNLNEIISTLYDSIFPARSGIVVKIRWHSHIKGTMPGTNSTENLWEVVEW